MRPSWDFFSFLFGANTHFLVTDFRSTVNKNVLIYIVQKGFQIPLAKLDDRLL